MAVTQARLKEIVYYHPQSGDFIWRKRSTPRATVILGTQAGTIGPNGYKTLCIDYKIYSQARLAWLYTHGRWPQDQIDHVNGDRSDNRIVNLREATNAQNQWNRRDVQGLSWSRRHGKYQVQLTVNGRRYNVGYFASAKDAKLAYFVAAKVLRREFDGRRDLRDKRT